jgi:glycosyltransferase involved in cell wall biosynthesis
VLPSRFEGLPTAIIEAMAAGRAVVATTAGGNAEVVEPGKTGWLVPPGRPFALADAISRALDSNLEEMGAEARRRATERLSASTMARSFADLYEEILQRADGDGRPGTGDAVRRRADVARRADVTTVA